MKKIVFLFIVVHLLAQVTVAQKRGLDPGKVKDIYENAEQLFLSKRYSSALDYLKKEAGEYLGVHDSLHYMKIKTLDKLYSSEHTLTLDLESELKLFFAKGNKYSFPELKYEEVSAIYSSFLRFKNKDKSFFDSIVTVYKADQIEALPRIKNTITEYLASRPNTYYQKELSGYVATIDQKLAEVALAKKNREEDSVKRHIIKNVGKKMNMSLSYVFASGNSKLPFTTLKAGPDVKNFYDGKYTGGLGIKYILNATVGLALINLVKGSGAKLALEVNIFDAEYAVMDWNSNSILRTQQTGGDTLKEMKSLKAGMRIGPQVAFSLSKKMAMALYFNARPSILFFLTKPFYSWNSGTGLASYSVVPNVGNYNMSSEVGIKFYFWQRSYINPYLHFGNYNWKSDIKDGTTTNDPVRVQTNYKFSNVGIRIGF